MNNIQLPKNAQHQSQPFIFGVATSSFQIEGAAEQRLDSIWDEFCLNKDNILDGSDGLSACEHIKYWMQDVDLVEFLGVDAYRFSVSWPRVMTREGTINKEGIAFYVALIEELNRRGIKPFVTLYHWDLPQYLEEQGGWLNRNTAIEFAEYVDKVSAVFGDKVYSYSTLNEPFCSAYLGYELGIHAPGLKSAKNGRQAAHNLLLAHGLAMKVLRKNCPGVQCGIVLNFAMNYGVTNSEEDRNAARIADEYLYLWFLEPLLKGRYPTLINDLDPDVLPHIEAGDLAVIAEPIDFLGINFYTCSYYRAAQLDGHAWFEECPTESIHLTQMGWEIRPDSFTDLLCKLNAQYSLPPIYITENGAALDDSAENGVVADHIRTQYLNDHLQAMDKAMDKGVIIKGYFAWSLMDNFEWAEGYTKRFGIVYVDYETQKRTVKQSGLAYRSMLLNRKDTNMEVVKPSQSSL